MISRMNWCSVLLTLPLMAAICGCSGSPKPVAPTVVTVRPPCITTKAPTLDGMMTCLDRASSGEDAINAAFDCLAHEILVRDAWIETQIKKCGAK